MKRELKYVWWKRNYFPHIILERPREINEMCKENGITRADDQFYIEDESIYIGKMWYNGQNSGYFRDDSF